MGFRYKYHVVYSLSNPDGEVYIGQTTDFINRRSRYKTLTCPNQIKVIESLRKHGFKKHKLDILKYFEDGANRSTLDFWEKFYYGLFEAAGYKLMNLKTAGWNGKPCVESRQKASLSRKGKTPWNKGKRGCQKAWNKGLKKADYGIR